MKVFTTGQVAKICKVAPRTVGKWFDSGRLKGYRIPGTQDRRIPREYLVKFLKEHGMPLGNLEDEALAKVLIVSPDPKCAEDLQRSMPAERSFKTATASSPLTAGTIIPEFFPDCVIIDFVLGNDVALQVIRDLRKNPDLRELTIIALLLAGKSSGLDLSGSNDAFVHPCDPSLVAERVHTLIGARKELA